MERCAELKGAPIRPPPAPREAYALSGCPFEWGMLAGSDTNEILVD